MLTLFTFFDPNLLYAERWLLKDLIFEKKVVNIFFGPLAKALVRQIVDYGVEVPKAKS